MKGWVLPGVCMGGAPGDSVTQREVYPNWPEQLFYCCPADTQEHLGNQSLGTTRQGSPSTPPWGPIPGISNSSRFVSAAPRGQLLVF